MRDVKKNYCERRPLEKVTTPAFLRYKSQNHKENKSIHIQQNEGGKTRSIKKYSLEKNTLRYSRITKIFIEINDSCKENRAFMLLKNLVFSFFKLINLYEKQAHLFWKDFHIRYLFPLVAKLFLRRSNTSDSKSKIQGFSCCLSVYEYSNNTDAGSRYNEKSDFRTSDKSLLILTACYHGTLVSMRFSFAS